MGFALFQAGSLLPRDAEASLTREVAELLKPVRPSSDASGPSLGVSQSSPARGSSGSSGGALGNLNFDDVNWPMK